MTLTEKAIRDFCGHHADWWPSTTQVQEMLALAQPCPTCEALARTVMLDQTSHDAQHKPLTDEKIFEINNGLATWMFPVETRVTDRELAFARAIEAAHGIKEKNNE